MRGRGVGFGLRAAFNGLAEQFPDVVRGLTFEVAEVLIARQHEVLNGLFQRARRMDRQHGQRFGQSFRGQG